MAAAAVLLGLLPTTLSLIGSNTVETGLLALRRPLLAGLLAAGTPAVAPMRMFDYDDPIELMSRSSPPPLSVGLLGCNMKTMAALVLVAEYLVAAAAVANLAHLSYLLSIQAVCSFSSETAFHPALWASFALLLHAWGALTVRLRVGVREEGWDSPSSSAPNGLGWFRARLYGVGRRLSLLFGNEFQTCVYGGDGFRLELKVKDKSSLFIFCTWVTSIATVSHIIYGTLIFSSILFVSTSDAMQIVARFVASTVICRVILVFEITGMRHRIGALTDNSGGHTCPECLKGGCKVDVRGLDGRRSVDGDRVTAWTMNTI